MNRVFRIALTLSLVLPCAAARASEAVFPPVSRVGIKPLDGLSPSRTFAGFEDPSNKVMVLFAELPAQAVEPTLRGMQQTGTTVPGVTNVKREVVLTESGAAHLISGDQDMQGTPTRRWMMLGWNSEFDFGAMVTVIVPNAAKQAYPDARLREMLATLSLRKEVPNQEVLDMMPFRISDTAGFRYVRSITPGRALVLTDDERPPQDAISEPQIVVAVGPGAPARPDDRERFAQQLAREIPGLREVRIAGSEAMRIGALPGHEVKLEGKDQLSGKPLTVVQWVRFGTNGFMRLVGVSASENWQPAYGRFRAVRDGIVSR